ncbi:MAG: hypothetical protein JXB32_13800, partial [Deltaproteobacteria bacterium]|nr:hypothetical protein [Deltaproteobacteria bacterium]
MTPRGRIELATVLALVVGATAFGCREPRVPRGDDPAGAPGADPGFRVVQLEPAPQGPTPPDRTLGEDSRGPTAALPPPGPVPPADSAPGVAETAATRRPADNQSGEKGVLELDAVAPVVDLRADSQTRSSAPAPEQRVDLSRGGEGPTRPGDSVTAGTAEAVANQPLAMRRLESEREPPEAPLPPPPPPP